MTDLYLEHAEKFAEALSSRSSDFFCCLVLRAPSGVWSPIFFDDLEDAESFVEDSTVILKFLGNPPPPMRLWHFKDVQPGFLKFISEEIFNE